MVFNGIKVKKPIKLFIVYYGDGSVTGSTLICEISSTGSNPDITPILPLAVSTQGCV